MQIFKPNWGSNPTDRYIAQISDLCLILTRIKLLLLDESNNSFSASSENPHFSSAYHYRNWIYHWYSIPSILQRNWNTTITFILHKWANN